MLPFREAVRTAGGLGLPSARATFANSLERRSSLFGALEHVWHQEALILTTLTRQGAKAARQVCTLLVLYVGMLLAKYLCTHTTTLWGVPEHDVCARLCVCGTDVVVLCAGLPAGTEDVTAAAAVRNRAELISCVLPFSRCSSRPPVKLRCKTLFTTFKYTPTQDSPKPPRMSS